LDDQDPAPVFWSPVNLGNDGHGPVVSTLLIYAGNGTRACVEAVARRMEDVDVCGINEVVSRYAAAGGE